MGVYYGTSEILQLNECFDQKFKKKNQTETDSSFTVQQDVTFTTRERRLTTFYSKQVNTHFEILEGNGYAIYCTTVLLALGHELKCDLNWEECCKIIILLNSWRLSNSLCSQNVLQILYILWKLMLAVVSESMRDTRDRLSSGIMASSET